jgi:putative PIN family toxin of toxin-antitoxin system
MRIVLDTNVLIAAFIAHGACSDLLEHVIANHRAVLSQEILDEFAAKLEGKFRYDRGEASAAAKLLRSRAELVEPQALPQAVCRDADDDVILATAIAGNCDCIVSGDKDLLILEAHEGVRIVSPSGFWRIEARQGAGD